MSPQFTDDEVGKTVVNANGEEIGMIAAVERGTARVDPDPGLTDTIKAALGWEDAGDEAFPLEAEKIEAITDDEVRLKRDAAASEGAAASSADEGIVDRDEGTERRDAGATSGEIGESDADREPPRTGADRTNAAERDPDAEREIADEETPDSVAGSEPDLGSEADPELGRDAEEHRQGAEPGSGTPATDDHDRTDAEVEPTEGTRRDDAEMDPTDTARRDDAEVEPTEGGRRTDAEIEPTDDSDRTDAAVDPEELGTSDTDEDDDREDTVTDARGRDEDR